MSTLGSLEVVSCVRFVPLKLGQLAFATTLGGDALYVTGMVSSDTVTSAVGASIVVVSTLANFYLTFKRKQTELDIETKVRYREEMRIQKEKDMRLAGRIRETTELHAEIEALRAENKKLRQQLGASTDGNRPKV